MTNRTLKHDEPTTDYYDLGNETWKVTAGAEQCPVCEAMSFIFSNRFGPYCCIGCSENLVNQVKALKEGVA